jgi:hypothetical protein
MISHWPLPLVLGAIFKVLVIGVSAARALGPKKLKSAPGGWWHTRVF